QVPGATRGRRGGDVGRDPVEHGSGLVEEQRSGVRRPAFLRAHALVLRPAPAGVERGRERHHGRSTAAPSTRSAARSASAWSADVNGYGVTVTVSRCPAAKSRNSRASDRVLAVTLRSVRSWNRSLW